VHHWGIEKIIQKHIEMTPEELIASKAGKACACACQEGFDTEVLHGGGAEETGCECGCIQLSHFGTWNSASGYPY
jgi:hypothetical protein